MTPRRGWRVFAGLVFATMTALNVAAQATAPAAAADASIAKALDAFHAAAAQARFADYFAAFAPDSVFIGTDAGERWTLAEFKAYAKPHFDAGRGWTYASVERHINIAPDGSHAWFDELLDNATLGRCRGTGVLRRIDGAWKIEQYQLTIPVPNALAGEVVKRIRAAP